MLPMRRGFEGQWPLGLLLLICLAYCVQPLLSPFFGGHDLASNLLPIVHYRRSILVDHTLPLYTDLWYGGRAQWQNPLWSFLYLPATVIWLTLPLQWAARLVMVSHLLGAAVAAWAVAGLTSNEKLERMLMALLLLSPIVVTLRLGHIEKLMAWPWVLLGLRFLLDTRATRAWRGVAAGICLGIIALTGANYYVVYAAILFGAVVMVQGWRLVLGMLAGSALGLLHLPSVWYLLGGARAVEAESVDWYSVTPVQAFQALFIYPPAGPATYESFAIGGAALLVALAVALCTPKGRIQWALLGAALLLLLLATGALYRGHHLLDTLRVPARAMAFVALAVVLFVAFGWQKLARRSQRWRWTWLVILLLACAQVLYVWKEVRPTGARQWLDNSGAAELAQTLHTLGARSVWFNAGQPADDLISIALNQAGIAVPNAYYGVMNQRIPVTGRDCGYAFDFVLRSDSQPLSPAYVLHSNTYPRIVLGSVPSEKLEFIVSQPVADLEWQILRVICD